MAKVRIGIATAFELENELVGIGTDNPTNTLQALGNIQSSDAKAIGVSTLTTYQGFVDTKLSLQGSGGAKQGTTSDEIIVEGEVTVSSGTTFTSGPENLTVTDSFTLPGISDDRPTVGTTRFNENLGSLEFYTGEEWRAVNSIVDMGTSGRAVSGGGALPSNSLYEGIQYFQIHTLGSAQYFGDLTAGRRCPSSAANRIRGIFHGGKRTPASDSDRIDYITMASAGNATDFNSDAGVYMGGTGASSSTRACFAGGYAPSLPDTDIDYVEIMTTGTTFDFADLFTGSYLQGSVMNPTRALFAGGTPGSSPYAMSEIQQITFANRSNAIDFGNLTVARSYASGVCSSTRGVFNSGAAGNTLFSFSDYVTIASAGNATDFGQTLYDYKQQSNGSSTQTRGVWSGGYKSPAMLNSQSYITIATTGNATDFGDLSVPQRYGTAMSDSHGGLGGY